MRVYLLNGCPFAHRAVMALREKGLPFELSFFEKGRRPPELEALGPMAKSPTLFDDDVEVFDSQVVLEYIEDRYPSPALLPTDAAERADVRMFSARVGEELMPKFHSVLSEAVLKPKAERDPAKLAEAKQAFVDALEPWEQRLKGREFALGEALTLGDLVLYAIFPAIQRFADLEIPEQYVNLRGYLQRMGARPSTAVPRPTA